MNHNSNKTINGATGSFILNIIVLVLFTILSITHNKIPSESTNISSQKNSRKENVKQNSVENPSTYTETYLLKKGEKFRVKIPISYNVKYSNPGVPYWKQAEGCDAILIGGGLPYVSQSNNARYVDFWCNEKEVNITCYFTRQK